jgi:hypothetical protein
LGVGHDEDSFPTMVRADFLRAEYSARNPVTQRFQVAADRPQPLGNMALDVLEKTAERTHDLDAAPDRRPEPARVFGPEPFPGVGFALARIGSDEKCDAISEEFAGESAAIRPVRCRVQASRFHFRDHICGCVGFDLTKSDEAQAWDNASEPEMISTRAKAPLD